MREINSEIIYNTLKHKILDLSLKPGQSMSEHELCDMFEVSRTPIRTALQRLQTEGLVKVIPYRGSTIELLDFDDIKQMIYLRTAVEAAVIRDFIPICTPMLKEKIHYQIRKQKVLVQGEHEVSQFYEMDSHLHYIWFHETGKDRLWDIIQKAQINYTRFRMLDITATQDFKAIIAEHEEFLQVIESSDLDKVSELVNRHLNGGVERLHDRIMTEFQKYFIDKKEN